MNKKIKLCHLLVWLLPVFNGYAEEITALPDKEAARYRYHHEGLAVNLSLGAMWGEAKEFVYWGSHKASQLNWKIKQASIVRAEINHDASPWFSVNVKGWTTLNGGQGQMDDYDWRDTTKTHRTDWSHHDDTPLNYAHEWDISLRGWLFDQENYRVGGLVGYQQNQASWTAYGGSYSYANGTNTGHFPAGQMGIGYTQQYNTPYIGLVGYYAIGDFEFTGVFKFSNRVRAKDYDEHYLRKLSFYEYTDDARFYSLSGSTGYFVTKTAKIVLDLAYTKYEAKRADTHTISRGSEKSDPFCAKCGGMESENYTLSVGLNYLF